MFICILTKLSWRGSFAQFVVLSLFLVSFYLPASALTTRLSASFEVFPKLGDLIIKTGPSRRWRQGRSVFVDSISLRLMWEHSNIANARGMTRAQFEAIKAKTAEFMIEDFHFIASGVGKEQNRFAFRIAEFDTCWVEPDLLVKDAIFCEEAGNEDTLVRTRPAGVAIQFVFKNDVATSLKLHLGRFWNQKGTSLPFRSSFTTVNTRDSIVLHPVGAAEYVKTNLLMPNSPHFVIDLEE